MLFDSSCGSLDIEKASTLVEGQEPCTVHKKPRARSQFQQVPPCSDLLATACSAPPQDGLTAAEDAVAAGSGAIRLVDVLHRNGGVSFTGSAVVSAASVVSILRTSLDDERGSSNVVRVKLTSGDVMHSLAVHALPPNSAAARAEQRSLQMIRDVDAFKAAQHERDLQVAALEARVAQALASLSLRLSDLEEEQSATGFASVQDELAEASKRLETIESAVAKAESVTATAIAARQPPQDRWSVLAAGVTTWALLAACLVAASLQSSRSRGK